MHIGKLHCTDSLGPANVYIVATHSGPANSLEPLTTYGTYRQPLERVNIGTIGAGMGIGASIGLNIGISIELREQPGPRYMVSCASRQ